MSLASSIDKPILQEVPHHARATGFIPNELSAPQACPVSVGHDASDPHGGETIPMADRSAMDLQYWRTRNGFYHQSLIEYLRFIVPEGESVLLIGAEDGALLSALKPSRGVAVDGSPEMIALGRKRHPEYRWLLASDCVMAPTFEPAESFEYVVLNDITGQVHDLFTLLQRIMALCTPTSRVVIVQHNYLWRPVLRLAARLGLKRPEARQNWLSIGDLGVFLDAVGFETIDVRSKLFCPKKLLGVGPAINWLAGLIPFAHRLASMEILIARPIACTADSTAKSASVVLTTRDERDNIKPIIRAIPDVGVTTEIIFVEGHSTDGTRAEIEGAIKAFPQKHIRLLIQDGIGQGDAIRKGFVEAKGDVIILLEADRTSPPEDILKAFQVVASGRCDYVNGSRFVYPRSKASMSLRSTIGNTLFAIWFTWFLGQRTSDVLCGLKAIDRRQFTRLVKQWGFLGVHDPFGDFELLFGAARLGLKILEVPTRYSARVYGRTKTRFFKHGIMLMRMALRATTVFKCR